MKFLLFVILVLVLDPGNKIRGRAGWRNPFLRGLNNLNCNGGWRSYVAEAMKEPSTKLAFTLVELLAVMFAIGLLATLFLPILVRPRNRVSALSLCVNNQKNLSLGFTVWKDDYNGKFPWQVSKTNNGTMEFVASGQASSQFKAELDLLAGDPNIKNPFKLFVCPSDKIKHAATNAATFADANTSYFINVDSDSNQANTILTGDRDLEANGKPAQTGFFKFSKGDAMNWSRELHRDYPEPIGALSFVDGHVGEVRGSDLTSVFEHQGSTTNRLVVP